MHIIGLRLTEDLEVERRLRPHTAPREEEDFVFPCAFYTVDFDHFLEDAVPWHWHRDVEIIEVTAGTLRIQSSKRSYTLDVGELCFINANALHQMLPAGSDAVCSFKSCLFQPDLVSGGWGNALDTRYVSPLLDCRDLDLLPFTAENPRTEPVRELLQSARMLSQQREFAYEFDVRTQLTGIWKYLCLEARPRLALRRTVDDRSEERIQAMLSYIQKNYTKKIGLAEIAGAAAISERECFRCFQKTLRVTPIHYLQNYRVRMAARRLLETDDTVLDISQSVGFTDNSYFGRIFQKYLHCSPSEFRKRNRAENEE
ncbi:MAG: helix-turn-helix domain-containing protein [Lachnospiraceae bacterium]|nr:helix-turn-helix domain-containing protein [Lachnospiraceae bacterium]